MGGAGSGFDLGDVSRPVDLVVTRHAGVIGEATSLAADHLPNDVEVSGVTGRLEQAVATIARERCHDGFPPVTVDLILGQCVVVRPEPKS